MEQHGPPQAKMVQNDFINVKSGCEEGDFGQRVCLDPTIPLQILPMYHL